MDDRMLTVGSARTDTCSVIRQQYRVSVTIPPTLSRNFPSSLLPLPVSLLFHPVRPYVALSLSLSFSSTAFRGTHQAHLDSSPLLRQRSLDLAHSRDARDPESVDYKYDSTSNRRRFDRRSTPIRLQFDRSTTIRQPTLRPVVGFCCTAA